MGQAKNRKAEINELKSQNFKKIWRADYVNQIKADQEEYYKKLLASPKEKIMEIMEEGDQERLHFAVALGHFLVKTKIATLAEVKDAAWEGFNGLLEACSVEMNIQSMLGVPVTPLDIDQFVFTGPDAMEKAMAAGMFN